MYFNIMRIILSILFGLGILGAGLLASSRAAAQPGLTWPSISLELVESGLASPVYLTHAGDGSGRIFVVEQAGRIRIIENGTLLQTPFLDISGRVRSPSSGGGGEEGLLSVAFPPQYVSKGYFYVYYTNHNGNNVVARFRVGGNPDSANPDSEENILLLKHPDHTNHNGGQLAFGPDGYLYIGTGDGGGGGDPDENAQNPGSLLGKLLRIAVEPDEIPSIENPLQVFLPAILDQGNTVTLPYSIPPDNPFVGAQGYLGEIWALGLRNPWRFSFDRQTRDLYIGEVGQVTSEEIDFQSGTSDGGENYGWDIMEGFDCFNAGNCNQSGLTLPVFSYPTHVNGSCSITGGYVYRGTDYSALQGIYFFADYCNGIIRGLQRDGDAWQDQELEDTEHTIPSFGEDQAGELYVIDHGGGIYQVTTP